jgi:hypothetical protein
MTSQFPILLFHHSVAFLCTIFLMVFMIYLATVLHSVWILGFVPQVSQPFFCFSKWSILGGWLSRSGSLSLLIDNLYAEAMDSVKSCTTLSASSHQLICIVWEIRLEAKLSYASQSVNVLTGSEGALDLTWYSMQKMTGRWLRPGCQRQGLQIFRHLHGSQYWACHYTMQENNDWNTVALK